MELEGKVAIVTGAGRGIGLSIARTLAGSGVRVMLNDAGLGIDGKAEDPGIAEKAASSLRTEGGDVRSSAANISTWNGASELFRSTTESLGPVDILVNNAAILQDKMVFNMEERSFEEVLRNNLFSAFYLTRLVSRDMRDRLQGRIVNMVSSSGLVGNRGQANYGAAKGGLVSLSRISALELARYGVTVNAIAPFAHTRVTETLQPNTPWLAEYLSTVKNSSRPESLAALVRYLCTERAKVVTGQIFGVRGDEVFLFTQPRPVGVQHAGKGKDLTDDFLGRAFEKWEEEGLFTPLETDLMLFSRRLK